MRSVYFSIIIPTLNEEKYLPKLLKALSSQTYRDFEVILVDGNSDDKTVEVFHKFGKLLPSSQEIVSEKRNVAYQRNLGGYKACGKYLVFFDADVNISPTFMEELHLASIKKKFDLATTWIEPDSNKSIDKVMLMLGNLGQELAKIVNKQFTGGYNTICTKEVFLKLKGFAEDQMINEDHDFALRANKKNIEICILQEPKVVFSLRRFRSEGLLRVLRKYAQAELYYLLKGPITHEMFEYRMGGHVHQKRRKRIDLTKFNTYLKALKKLEKKIIKLIE